MQAEDDCERRASYLQASVSAAFEMGRALVLQTAKEFSEAADCASSAEQASRLALRLGASRIEVVVENEPPREVRIDSYPGSVISEVFESARTFFHAVGRAQIYTDAAATIRRIPDTVFAEGASAGNAAEVITAEAWDLVEVAYFRAAACWDRIGQLLAFVFFNVRDYREGFAETMKKLRTNFDVDDLPLRRLRHSPDWVFLRQFETRTHGTLASKRNLVAHRISAGHVPSRDPEDDPRLRFVSYADHLQVAGTPFDLLEDEVTFLRAHLFTVRDGVSAALSLCLWWRDDDGGHAA